MSCAAKLRAAPALERQRGDDVEQRLRDRERAVVALEADDRRDEARLHAVVRGDAANHLAVLGHERLAALDSPRADAPQIGFVRLDELGLRSIGLRRLGGGCGCPAARRRASPRRCRAPCAVARISPRNASNAAPSAAASGCCCSTCAVAAPAQAVTMAIASQTAGLMSVPSLCHVDDDYDAATGINVITIGVMIAAIVANRVTIYSRPMNTVRHSVPQIVVS